MKKVLAIVSSGVAAEAAVRAVAKGAGVGKRNLLLVRDWPAAHRAIETQSVSAIILADILDDDLSWQHIYNSMIWGDREMTILLRVGLDESTEPYDVEGFGLYASVHGRTPTKKLDSPIKTLKRLLKGG